MSPKKLPPATTLRRLLEYDPNTGVLKWRARSVSMFRSTRACNAWNARFAGTVAGTVDKNGYRHMAVLNTVYAAHRIAWKMHYGKEPPAVVDHENLDPDDCRIANLRSATAFSNAHNKGMYSNNSSGVKGVTPHKSGWQARVGVNGRSVYLGVFSSVAAAERAVKEARRELHKDFARDK